MDIVFFGTSCFSKIVAEHILNSNHKIVAIVSQPDKVNGRNNKIVFNDLKVFAIENNIPIYQFEKLNRDGEEILKSIKCDVFVTASYGQIIKQNILDIAPIYNVHASLLPKYRGSSPIQWCLINNETKTGVTIMKTELGVDCGEMYLQKECEIEDDDTFDSLSKKLADLGGECIVEFLDNYNKYIKLAKAQDENKMTYFPMLKKEMSLIDFDKSSTELINLIRGLNSCMTCYFMFNGVRYKVYSAKEVENIENVESGTILSVSPKIGLKIKTSDGAIEILTIQPEGKKIMSAKDFCNGCKLKTGDIIRNENTI